MTRQYKNKVSKGFSPVEIILIIAFIALLGVVIWLVIDRLNGQDTQKSDDNSIVSQNNTSQDENKTKDTIDVTVHTLRASLSGKSDTNKLPAHVPQSFKEYIGQAIEAAKSGANECGVQYTIEKVSSVNVRGGVGPAISDTDNCPGVGGSPLAWALTPNGTWEEIGLNGALCTGVGGGKLYVEFVEECYSDSLYSEASFGPNVNGSIKKLAN